MKTTERQRYIRAAVRPPLARLRLAVTLLALVAFTFQSFVLQTHIHGLPQTAVTAVDGSTAASSRDDKSPADTDQANCPLCQEFQHSGAYVMPAAFAALPPTLVVGLVALTAAPLLATKPASHNWMGRAPPVV